MAELRAGLVVNPVAGMGGPVGLKGSDDREALSARGAEPTWPARAARFLARVRELGVDVAWTTCPGPMGADALERAGIDHDVVGTLDGPETDAKDTRRLVPEVAGRVDVVVLLGGDGTAADVAAVAGDVPVIGVPAGVKMHSGVYAQDPEAAAEILAAVAAGEAARTEAAVRDLDEAELRAGRLALTREGTLRTFEHPLLVPTKSERRPEAEARRALAGAVAADVETGRWILGPGSTLLEIKRALGGEGTPLGVDLVRDGEIVVADADEAACLDHAGPDTGVVVTPIGGQGLVLGRGNQPISAEVVRRCGVENVVVVATPGKVRRLDGLRFDTGDASLDRAFGGHVRVRVGPQRTRVMRVRRGGGAEPG